MKDLSYEIKNNINERRKNSMYLNFRNNSLIKSSKKNIIGLSSKDISLSNKYDNEDSEEEKENEEEKLFRLREERKKFLIELLTESPKQSNRKKGYKLRPLNQSKYSLNKTLNKNHVLTEPNSISNSMPKFMSIKEKRKWELKLKKEKERKEREKERKENQKILNEIKNIRKLKKNREIFRSNLNRLYGYNQRFLFFNSKLKKEKCDNLDKYQDNILRVSSINLSRDNMLKLYTDLKNIKLNSELAKPLPPINFKLLVDHSLDEGNERKKYRKLGSVKKFSEMDDYEKEMYKIKINNRHEKMNITNNKLLYKMYEILPEHVVETIYGKKRK